ncbi:FHA domain-containing protein [Rhodanobacter sp. FDAARGOS 1247]|uniref:FHA domain-containing protein n=1 Tax=Rhodanobacter sp. FDAARGOS 1247 TaxID=2778082 RepID=UPI001951FAF4|nr:FHA domain-containing protein [Rhodanobacter sp. FDAARGOS 1247]QRP64448.1 FHA domain-containing protein [Rhodanobacter sp. FDAARGOS 1247]
MNGHNQTPTDPADKRSSGPQGTRFFSTEMLRRYTSEAEAPLDGLASVHQPVLEGISPGLAGRRFTLNEGRQTIGRGNDNHIVVDDPSVSASHAWITNKQGRHIIMNTLSTNGTFVNDKRIHMTMLKHSDHIRLGHAEFVFLTREHDVRRAANGRRIAAGALVLMAVVALAWWLI